MYTSTTEDDSMTTTNSDLTTTEIECPPPLDPLTSPCECFLEAIQCPELDEKCEWVDDICRDPLNVFAPVTDDDDGGAAGMKVGDGDGVVTGGFDSGTNGTTMSIIGGVIAAGVIILCLVIGGIICVKKGNKYDNILTVDECECNGDSERIEFGRAMPMETGPNGETTGKTHT
eukprot:UN08259